MSLNSSGGFMLKAGPAKKKRRFTARRKRTLDPNTTIDYKKPDILRRFITDRGKIIPRRISGATAKQQRQICEAVKRARFLGLIPYSGAHRHERGFPGEMSSATSMQYSGGHGGGMRRDFRQQDPSQSQGGDRDGGEGADEGEEE